MRVFVTGLSKSGKSTRCMHFAQKFQGMQYVSVSKLIRKAGGVLPVTTLADGLANQQTAAHALLIHLGSSGDQIIDGHALIETQEGPLLVPDRFFDEIKPDLMVHVREHPEEILARRSTVASPGAVNEIAALTKLSQAACERAANRLGISVLTSQSSTLDEFCLDLERHLSHR